jgi:hypothetical protein
MSLRALNQRWLHPVSQTLMILGIAALYQPWSFFLHRHGVTMILVGLIGFMITSKILPEEKPEEETLESTREGATDDPHRVARCAEVVRQQPGYQGSQPGHRRQ